MNITTSRMNCFDLPQKVFSLVHNNDPHTTLNCAEWKLISGTSWRRLTFSTSILTSSPRLPRHYLRHPIRHYLHCHLHYPLPAHYLQSPSLSTACSAIFCSHLVLDFFKMLYSTEIMTGLLSEQHVFFLHADFMTSLHTGHCFSPLALHAFFLQVHFD